MDYAALIRKHQKQQALEASWQMVSPSVSTPNEAGAMAEMGDTFFNPGGGHTTALTELARRTDEQALKFSTGLIDWLKDDEKLHPSLVVGEISPLVNFEATVDDVLSTINGRGSALVKGIWGGARERAGGAEKLVRAGAMDNAEARLAALDALAAGQAPDSMDDPKIRGHMQVFQLMHEEGRLKLKESLQTDYTRMSEGYERIVDKLEEWQRQRTAWQLGRQVDFTDIRDRKSFLDWLVVSGGQGLASVAEFLMVGALSGGYGVVPYAAISEAGSMAAETDLRDPDDPNAGLRIGIFASLSGISEVAIGAPTRILGLRRGLTNVTRDVQEKVAKGYLRRVGREAGMNALEEFTQEGLQFYLSEMGVEGGDFEFDNETLIGAFNAAMIGLLSGGAFGTAFNVRSQVALEKEALRLRDAGLVVRSVKELAAVTRDLKLPTLSPKKFKELAGKLGLGNMKVFYQAEDIADFVQAQGLDLEESLGKLGVDMADFMVALSNGNRVTVTGEGIVAMGLEQPAAEKFWSENGALRPDGGSQSEVTRFSEDVQLRLQELREEVAIGAASPSRQALVTQISDAIVAAGQSPELASTQALPIAAMYETLAARYSGGDMSGAQLFERYGFRIERADGRATKPATTPAGGGTEATDTATTPAGASVPRAVGDQVMYQSPIANDRTLLQQLVDQGAPVDRILNDPSMAIAVAEMRAIPQTMSEEDAGVVDNFLNRSYTDPATGETLTYIEMIEAVDAVSKAYAKGPLRQERRIDILIGPPAAGKSTVAEIMAPEMGARIVDPDDIKKFVPAYKGGIGAMAVHEESSALAKMALRAAMKDGDNIVLPKVGENAERIARLIEQLKAEGYTVNLVNMQVNREEAFRRMVSRYIHTGRVLDPHYAYDTVGNRPTETYETLKAQGVADGYANYDNEVPYGQPPRVLEDLRGGSGRPNGAAAAEGSGERGAGPVVGAAQGLVAEGRQAARQLNQPALDLFDNALPMEQRTIKTLATQLHKRHMAIYGRQLFPETSSEDLSIVVDSMAQELRAQMARPNSGIGWYSLDVERALHDQARVPGFETLITDEAHRNLFLTMAGIFSSGTDPDQAWGMAAMAFEGAVAADMKVPVTRADAARAQKLEPELTTFVKNGKTITQPKGWGIRAEGNNKQLALLSHVIETTGGLAEASRWLMERHTPTEINEMMISSGLYKEGAFTTKKEVAGPQQFGALIFGPKLGRYTVGLYGVPVKAGDTTIDLWYVRSYRRLTGRLFEKPIGKEGIASQPANDTERDALWRITEALADRLGLTPGDVQAAMWFFEKRLYREHGITVKEGTNSSGAARFTASRGLAPYDGGRGARTDEIAGAAAEGAEAHELQGVRGASGGYAAFRGHRADVVREYPSARPVVEIAEPEIFRDLIARAQQELGPSGVQVEVYDDYAGKRLFVFDDGYSGFALDGDNIVSVFSVDNGTTRGAVRHLMPIAVREGGRRLDAFDTYLPRIYAANGFRAVADLSFSREAAPKGWDYETMGEPDVTFMVFDPDNASPEAPTRVPDYDAGVAAQMEALAGVKILEQPGWHGTPHVFEPAALVLDKETGKKYVTPKDDMLAGLMEKFPGRYEILDENDKGMFDHSKMGTGEGAQAFGWGSYIAQRKGVGDSYRPGRDRYTNSVLLGTPPVDINQIVSTSIYENLFPQMRDAEVVVDGEVIPHAEVMSAVDVVVTYTAGQAAAQFEEFGGPDLTPETALSRALQEYQIQTNDLAANAGVEAAHMRRQGLRQEDIDQRLRDLKVEIAVVDLILSEPLPTVTPKPRPGRLYRVDVPEIDQLMLWDEPLRMQSPGVRAALLKVADAQVAKADLDGVFEEINAKGAQLLDEIRTAMDEFTGPGRRAEAEIDLENSQHFLERLEEWGSELDDNDIVDMQWALSQAAVYSRTASYLAGALREALDTVDAVDRFLSGDLDEMTGRDLYYALARARGPGKAGERAVSLTFAKAGIPGHAFLDGMSRRKGEGSYNFVIYDETTIKILDFEQPTDKGGPRGMILLPDAGLSEGVVIRLTQSADQSTLMHEAGHFFLELFTTLAGDPNAPQQMKADLAALHEWLGGVQPGQNYSTAQHEQFATGFEKYLMEGKAPSVALQSVFSLFKRWLTKLYQSSPLFQQHLTPEIRDIFDRMMATEEEIELAKIEEGLGPLLIQKPAGMADEDYEGYRRSASLTDAEASERLLTKALETVKRKRTKEWKEQRAALVDEHTARLSGEQVYQLLARMERDGVQLNRKELTDRFDKEITDSLSRYGRGKRAIVSNKGASLDVVAELAGYATVDDMVTDLYTSVPLAEAAVAAAEQQMEGTLDDITTNGTMREEAVAALHNNRRWKMLQTEQTELRRQIAEADPNITLPTPLTIPQLRAMARAMIADMTVANAENPETFLRAERQAGRQARTAYGRVHRASAGATLSTSAAKDLMEAHNATQRELLNSMLYAEARKVQTTVRQIKAQEKRLRKASHKNKIASPFVEQIISLLQQYDFRKLSKKEAFKRHGLQALHKELISAGFGDVLAVRPSIVDQLARRPYSTLPVSQLRDLQDTLDNLEKLGRTEMKLFVEDREVRYRDVKINALTTLGFHPDVPASLSGSKAEARAVLARQLLNTVSTADTIIAKIDQPGDEKVGYWWKAIKAPISSGMSRFQARSHEARQRIDKIFKEHYGSNAHLNSKAEFRSEVGASMTKAEILAVALNTGNEDNMNRLLNGSHVVKFTGENVQALLDAHMSETDWRFVQAFWDEINSYWGEIAANERKLTGVYPTKVDAKLGVRAPSFVRGGYYPIRYDPRLGVNVDEFSQNEVFENLRTGRMSRAQTKHGHVFERQQAVGKPLYLSLSVGVGHINDVIFDLELRQPVQSAWRLLNDQDVSGMMKAKGLEQERKALVMWLQDVAVGDRQPVEGLNKLLRHLRSGMSIAKMGFSLTTIIQQPLGLLQSGVVVGNRQLLRGALKYLSSPRRYIQNTLDASPFMAERWRLFERDMAVASGMMDEDPVYSKWTAFHRSMVQVAFAAIQTSQFYMVDMPTWIAAHDKFVERHGTTEGAAEYADQLLARAQGSGMLSDRSAIERGHLSRNEQFSEFARFATTFGSYMIGGKLNVAIQEIRQGRGANAAAVAAVRLVFNLMVLYAAESLLSQLLTGRWYDDDDDDEPLALWMAKETAYGVMGSVPLLRDVAGTLQGFDSGGAQGQALGSVGDLVGGTASVAHALFSGEGEEGLRTGVRQIIKGGSVLGQLPGVQFERMLTATFERDMSVRSDFSAWDLAFGRRD